MKTQVHTPASVANYIMHNGLSNARVFGINWPHNAEFALISRVSTWPVGWSETAYMDFFATEEELNAALAELREWSKCEDNYFACRAYRWDWGPAQMPEHNQQEHMIGGQRHTTVGSNDLSKWNDAVNARIEEMRIAAQPMLITVERDINEPIILHGAPELNDDDGYW